MEHTRTEPRLFSGDLSDSNKILHRLSVIRKNLNLSRMFASEYGEACLRIRNAKRYLQSNEIGAARQEVRMLHSQLDSLNN